MNSLPADTKLASFREGVLNQRRPLSPWLKCVHNWTTYCKDNMEGDMMLHEPAFVFATG